jgi:hypothetical protein
MGKPLCNSLIQPTSKNHITAFLKLGRDHQFPGFLPRLIPSLLKILKTAEHFLGTNQTTTKISYKVRIFPENRIN